MWFTHVLYGATSAKHHLFSGVYSCCPMGTTTMNDPQVAQIYNADVVPLEHDEWSSTIFSLFAKHSKNNALFYYWYSTVRATHSSNLT